MLTGVSAGTPGCSAWLCRFIADVVNNPDSDAIAQDSDGNALGPEVQAYALFSVVIAMVEKKAFRYKGVVTSRNAVQTG